MPWLHQVALPNCRNFLKFLDFKKKCTQVITNSQFRENVDLTQKKGGGGTEKNRIYPTEKRKKKKNLIGEDKKLTGRENIS